MSHIITLKKDSFDLYRVEKFQNIPLDALADFLIRDGSFAIDFSNAPYFENDAFIAWLRDKDPQNDWIGGNTMEMVKKGNKIFLDSQFREDRDDYSNSFNTTIDNMLHILLQWYNLLAMDPHPDEILLFQEGDIISIMPKFSHNSNMAFAAYPLKR